MQYSHDAVVGKAPGPPLRFTAGGKFESAALLVSTAIAEDDAGGDPKRQAPDEAGGSDGRKCWA